MGHKITVGPKADPDSETVVFSKHWNSSDIAYAQFCRLRGQRVVYDVCDDHFGDSKGAHYFNMIQQAHYVTVNSQAMADRLQEATGVTGFVIEDPVIHPPKDFVGGEPRMVWYGNPQNLPGLIETYDPNAGIPLRIVIPGRVQLPEEYHKPYISFCDWHPRVIEEVAQYSNIAILPYRQGKEAKSANRVLEAIQSGMFVMTDEIPATKDIPGVWFLKDGFKEGIECYLKHGKEAVEAGKEYIRPFFPDEIVKKWLEVL